jgi:DNA-binding CsgD family transcriptional regulator
LGRFGCFRRCTDHDDRALGVGRRTEQGRLDPCCSATPVIVSAMFSSSGTGCGSTVAPSVRASSAPAAAASVARSRCNPSIMATDLGSGAVEEKPNRLSGARVIASASAGSHTLTTTSVRSRSGRRPRAGRHRLVGAVEPNDYGRRALAAHNCADSTARWCGHGVRSAHEAIREFEDGARVPSLAADVGGELAEVQSRAAVGELLDPPSPAELAVLRLLDTDLSVRQIGEELFMSANTVRTHTRSIYRKLSVNSRADAVTRAGALGLLGIRISPR